jgi:hypothetical protein
MILISQILKFKKKKLQITRLALEGSQFFLKKKLLKYFSTFIYMNYFSIKKSLNHSYFFFPVYILVPHLP